MDDDLLKVAIVLQKKGNAFFEIFNLTKQLQEVVTMNDMVSVKMLMNERKEAILTAAAADDEVQEVLSSIPDDKRKMALEQMSKDFVADPNAPPGSYRLNEIYVGLYRTIVRIIEINDKLTAKYGFTSENRPNKK